MAAIALAAIRAFAFPVETYAPHSVLAEGKWVKISVAQSGMHLISAATLRDWGFSSPEKVRVYGYGGAMLPDILSLDTYVDDLPPVPAVVTSRGLTFYAVGPSQTLMKESGLGHDVNPYSSFGYYFLSEAGEAPALPSTGSPSDSAGAETTGDVILVHEQDLTSPGGSGRMMVGEDFNATRSRNFNFSLPGNASDKVKLRTAFWAHSSTGPTQLSFAVDGSALEASANDRVPKSSGESGTWGADALTTRTLAVSGEKFTLTLGISNPGVLKGAALDYFELLYTRRLAGSMEFFSAARTLRHDGAGGAGTHVWDVTDPRAVSEVKVSANGGWQVTAPSSTRKYVVWSEGDAMPSPKRVATVRNQDLHGLEQVPDMVIIAPDAYLSHARQIAELHHTYEPDPIAVEVVSLDQVLNEFGSGAFDPGALRRYLKMLHDRGQAAGTPLRHALMIGKGTCDNRRLTPMGRGVSSPMPLWVSEASLNESTSYSSDDFFALLDDNDGTRPQREQLNIAVGRIPATRAEEAQIAVDKIRQYLYSMPRDNWRTRLTVLADDENEGKHMEQAEEMLSNMEQGPSGSRYVVNKVYCDAYPRSNSTYPRAKEILFGDFADGVGVFVFIGHGSPTAIGSKLIISPTDFRTRFHTRRLPFWYAATCSFLHWDGDITSQAEKMMFQADGGIIGCISALRPVFISANGNLSAAFGKALGQYDTDGRVLTMGELYRRAKNGVPNDANKFRYVLMADPALRLSLPSAHLVLESVNGVEVNADAPATLMARQQLTLTGRVEGTGGELMENFNGTVYATLYDAEHSTTTHGYGDGKEYTFEQKGDMLFTVAGPVTGGRFTLSAKMPVGIADNYRPATLGLYAASAEGLTEAAGLTRSVYVFGFDEEAEGDAEPPVIHSLTLNGDSFTDGMDVNPSPQLRATVSDNVALNLSSAGVGAHMSLLIDDKTTYFDVSRYFTPDAVPSSGAMSGTINYPLPAMAEGAHTLRLRVWDIDGNFTDRTVSCNVVADLAPEIYEVFANVSVARTEAKFSVRHNRPDQLVKVRVTVYNLLGAPVWSGEKEAVSNLGVTEPVVWPLTDEGGHRVGRGIYVYRAEVTTEGSTVSTASRKIAVSHE